MKIIYSDEHLHHAPQLEFNRGRMVPAFETPARAGNILEAVKAANLGPVEAPAAFPDASLQAVHSAAYLDFLSRVYDEWKALGREGDVLPMAWPLRRLPGNHVPDSLDGRLGFYSFDIGSPITAGTWAAARAAANVALTGAREIAAGAASAFALCRPPGHHAGTDFYGGYCYLNNAAIAAQFLRDAGAGRVAILDVDYHHGNGTQQIFYERADVLFASLHGDPAKAYPYFLGYADETGRGAGEGCNANFPLPEGTAWGGWSEALEAACRRIADYAPDALVVSLGVDTFRGDPISAFRLESDDYLRLGARLARLGRPTLFVMEGGYAVAEIGTNVANVLRGFEDAR